MCRPLRCHNTINYIAAAYRSVKYIDGDAGLPLEEESRKRAFYRVAWNVHHLWEEKGSSDTRLFLPPIISDKHVIAGRSLNGGNYKEHVVPRLMICEECHRRFASGHTVEEVAEFIEKFLKIVLITKQEQRYLDGKDQLNLKQTMPPDWSWEDGDVFARLNYAEIKFSSMV